MGLEESSTKFIIVNPDCSSIITTPPSPHGGLIMFRTWSRQFTLETEVTNIIRYNPHVETLVMKSHKPCYKYDVEFIEDDDGLVHAEGILEGIVGFPQGVRAVLRRTTKNLSDFVLHIHSMNHADRCAYIRGRGMQRLGSILTVSDPGEENDGCSICIEQKFQLGDQVQVLSCRHKFHVRCIAKWLEEKPICPLCKRGVLPIHKAAAAWKLHN